jgi:mRNA interferase RelE/StbE
LSAGWRYRLTPRAERDFKRLDRTVQRRVIDALDRLVAGDRPQGDIRKIGDTEWRLRVGEWRVRFERDNDALAIVVLRILPRGRAYRH